MIRCLFATIVLGCLSLPVSAASRLDPAAIDNADYSAKPPPKNKIDPVIVKAEVLLDVLPNVGVIPIDPGVAKVHSIFEPPAWRDGALRDVGHAVGVIVETHAVPVHR